MAHAQKPDSVFQRNGRVQLYRRGCQFSRVLAFLECGSRENGCSNTEWTVPSQTENCWLPSPFASFPFTSPPVRHRVPSDSVSTLLICNAGLCIPIIDCMSENYLAIAYTALAAVQIPCTPKQEQLNEFNNQSVSDVYWALGHVYLHILYLSLKTQLHFCQNKISEIK